MYRYIKDNNKGGRTAKGIKKSVIKKDINHINYKETLFSKQQMHHKMKTIRSNCHKISSYKINKVSLSCFDNKRYLLDDAIKVMHMVIVKYLIIHIKQIEKYHDIFFPSN